jgi:TfoX/Sxy family transcriptional regulator of competence genes
VAEPYLEMLSELVTSLDLPNSVVSVLECKHFFGGAALYVQGKICASLSPAGFGLKLPAEARDRLIDEGDGTELRYFEKSPVKLEYVVLSQSVVDDRERLTTILNLSLSYVMEHRGTA